MIIDILAFVAMAMAAAFPLTKSFWFETMGFFRSIESINSDNCHSIPELQACTDSYFHSETGLLYLTCSSSIESRSQWIPRIKTLTSPSQSDYIAILDTRSETTKGDDYQSAITKIPINDFWRPEDGHLNLNSIGIFIDPAAKSKGSLMTIFLSNQRPIFSPIPNKKNGGVVDHGAAIEIFESKLGSKKLSHLSTISSDLIQTPSSVYPLSKSSFFLTNSHDPTLEWDRGLVGMIRPHGDVVVCEEKHCKKALAKSHYPNGMIYSEKQRLFYISSGSKGYVKTYKFHEGNSSLSLVDDIYTSYPAENLMIDEKGEIWITTFPSAWRKFSQLFSRDPRIAGSPTTVLKLSLNKDFNGSNRKYNLIKAFESDGNTASSTTNSVFDVRTHRLYLNGMLSPALTVCQLP